MIRQAKARDEAAIRDCAQQAYHRYVAAIGREPAPMNADYAAEIAAGRVYIAVDNEDEPLGFVVFFPADDTMLLENVAVHPQAAGQGLGRQLIAFCEDAARWQRLASVSLYTNAKMTENLSIYPRFGYTQIDRRNVDGFDRVFFEKTMA